MTKEEANQYTVGELVYVAVSRLSVQLDESSSKLLDIIEEHWHLAIVVSIVLGGYMAEEYSAVEVYDLKQGCNTSRVVASNLKKLK